MDTSEFAAAIGKGFATGIGTLFAITLVTLPASVVMNRFIYHHGAIRTILGILAGIGSVFTLGFIAFQRIRGAWPKLHYFGLIPMFETGGSAPPSDGQQSWWGWLMYFVRIFTHPFLMFPNEAGYAAAVEGLLVPTDDANNFKKVVDEKLYAMATDAAATADHREWSAKMGQIQNYLGTRT